MFLFETDLRDFVPTERHLPRLIQFLQADSRLWNSPVLLVSAKESRAAAFLRKLWCRGLVPTICPFGASTDVKSGRKAVTRGIPRVKECAKRMDAIALSIIKNGRESIYFVATTVTGKVFQFMCGQGRQAFVLRLPGLIEIEGS
jgi:hypothetical protein